MEELIGKIEKLKKAIASDATPKNFIPKMKETVATLEKELADKKAEAKSKSDKESEKKSTPPAPKAPEKKAKKEVKKAEPKTTKRRFKTSEKPAKKEDNAEDPDCDELISKFHQAKANRKKNAKKSAKISVSEKIGNDLADAVNKAIKNTPAEEIKDKPKVYIAKYERLEKVLEDAGKAFKAVLGEDFDKEDLFKPLHDAIAKIIADIKKKTGK